MSGVLVLGAGGLGCPGLLALLDAGVRDLTLVDPDRVELSNLHRQLWHHPEDLGRAKVFSAKERALNAFPTARIRTLEARVDASNVDALFREHTWILDGTDRVSTKLMLSDAAVRTGVTLVYGGVVKLEGQVLRIEPGGPCLRCVYEAAPDDRDVPSCSSAGVMGSLAGVVAALQVEEGVRAKASRRLLRVDGLALSVRRVKVRKNPACEACGVEGARAARQDT